MDQPQARIHQGPRRRWPLAAGALVMGRAGRRRLLLVVPAVIALGLATAACGGSPKAGVALVGTTAAPASAAASGGPSSNADRVRELVQFATCVRSHGVLNFPAPGSPSSAMRTFKESGAMSSPQFQAAALACAKYAPPEVAPPRISTQDQADYLKAAVCMRNHGIVGFPDPVFSGGQVDYPIPQGMNTKSTQFLRAREIL